MINNSSLKELIEPHFHKSLVSQKYSTREIDAADLLTNSRLDIAFKLLFLELYDLNQEYAVEIYSEHLKAATAGAYTEFGNSDKDSLDKFIKIFFQIHESLQNGFNNKVSLIPVSKNGGILNGSHRIASAILLNKKVCSVTIEHPPEIQNYEFFLKRNVDVWLIEKAVNKFIEYSKNAYLAIIWPSAEGSDLREKSINMFSNVIYRKDIEFTPNGGKNLISQVYKGEEWVGSAKDNFKGALNKAAWCFSGSNNLATVIAFQSKSLSSVIKIKEEIRSLFGIDKHSIHITDSNIEAVALSKMLFNDNSIHFLNHANLCKYLSTEKKFKTLAMCAENTKLNKDEFLVDGSFILEIYGIRESQDIDVITIQNNDLSESCVNIDKRDSDLKYHNKNKADLVFNDRYSFPYNGIKFVSFKQLHQMKKNRGEKKDCNDLKLMSSYIASDKLTFFKQKVKSHLLFSLIKLKIKIMNFMIKVGIYKYIRPIYKKIF